MSMRSYRACLVCSYIQTYAKFNSAGCPNCEDFLEMRGNPEVVQECTSQVFEGMITLNADADGNTNGSWVAKWQRLEGYVPGLYAVKVVGTLPPEYIAAALNVGVNYAPRDGSDPNAEEP